GRTAPPQGTPDRRRGRRSWSDAPRGGRAPVPRAEETPRVAPRRVGGRSVSDDDREERLNEVLLAYVEAREAGREPDRAALLAAHPDLSDDLLTFFAGHDEVERLAVPLRECGVRSAERGTKAEDTGPQPDLGQLGDFSLVREVGRGGMGVVYEA